MDKFKEAIKCPGLNKMSSAQSAKPILNVEEVILEDCMRRPQKMRKKFNTNYPDNWTEIASRIKAQNGNRCERCGHGNDPAHGYTLTVHHLDGDKSNCADWNLAALCQRCHLRIQGKVFLPQFYMLEHSEWMKPHLEGYYRSLNANQPNSRTAPKI